MPRKIKLRDGFEMLSETWDVLTRFYDEMSSVYLACVAMAEYLGIEPPTSEEFLRSDIVAYAAILKVTGHLDITSPTPEELLRGNLGDFVNEASTQFLVQLLARMLEKKHEIRERNAQ